MTRLRKLLVCAAAMCALFAGPAVFAYASGPTEIDVAGPVEADQSAPTENLVVDTVTTPTATSVNGDSTSGLTTTVLAPNEVDSPDYLQIYTSTESGTSALSGVVTGTSDVVSGATVTLQPSGGGSTTTATTGSNGGFAFVNMPVNSSGTTYTLTVSAPGYGTYSVANDLYLPDTTYETTVNLTTDSQSYDASQAVSQGTQNTSASGSLAPYTSWHRPPPVILVGIYNQTSSCGASGSLLHVTKYPFKYYALHVTASEIPHGWLKTAVKANMLAEINYAWYFLRHPPNSSYNVNNTTDYQCFETWQKVPSSWPTWMDDVFNSALLQSGDIQITQYRAGSYQCSDPNFPANGNILSQWGSLALAQNCNYTTYKSVDNYYYTGSFDDNTIPPVPDTSYSRPSGEVTLYFPSHVSDGNGHLSNVGWVYLIDRYDTNLPTPHWITFHKSEWRWSSRTIPTSYTFSPSQCYKYRVNASNPIGTSEYASYNNGNQVCPG